jgi:hypothetical protein
MLPYWWPFGWLSCPHYPISRRVEVYRSTQTLGVIRLYRKAVVTFLDVLGFKHLVETRSPEDILKILKAVKRFTAGDQDPREDKEFNAFTTMFSDCVVRVRPIDTAANKRFPIGIPYYEIVDLLHAQCELINLGILVRGAVTFGDIYFDAESVFGPALVDAYNLESKLALYPRIVISSDLLMGIRENDLMRSKAHSVAEEFQYINGLISCDGGSVNYIDYIRAIHPELDESSLSLDFLLKHQRLVCDGILNFKNAAHVRKKYEWMGEYHNQFIDSIDEQWFQYCDTEMNNLKVCF